MICAQCHDQRHSECESRDCFCQHRTTRTDGEVAHFGCGT